MTLAFKPQEWMTAAYRAIDHSIGCALVNAQQGTWREDSITATSLVGLLSIGKEFRWADNGHGVKWDGYKLAGVQETEAGDVAIFVRVQLTKNRYVDGVAYYESKRQYFDGIKRLGFLALRHDQIVRIASKTHASNIVLYDADIVDSRIRRTYAEAIPAAFMKELADPNELKNLRDLPGEARLREHGRPWAISLCENLRGQGLDFDPKHVMEMRDKVLHQSGPRFVLNATVSHALDLELTLDNFLENVKHYERQIGSSEAPTQENEIEPHEPRGGDNSNDMDRGP